MHPIICKIGPFTIYSYGLMLALAFMAAVALALQKAKKENIDPEPVFNLFFLSLIFGIAGARIFYVVENIGYYLKNPLEIAMLQRGGLSWFGGLMAGVVFGVGYLKKRKLPAYKTFDLFVPYLALAQGIGRVGCLFNGCCGGVTVIPVQIYSSAALIFIFIILRFLQDRPHRQGQIFFSYFLLYSIKRFFIEFWRSDNAIVLFGLTLFQLISVGVFFLGFFKLLSFKKTKG